MKKITALILVASIAVLPAGAEAAKKKKKKKPAVHQHVEGAIGIPQPYAADGTCIYRGQRALMSMGAEDANGTVGYTFDVDPRTAGKKFKLTVSDGAGVDIAFYSELGDASDPTTAPTNTGFETPGPGGEKGKVPAGYPIAFVCMTEGADATFTYKAGKGV